MNIQQLSATYQPEDDRILLRIMTGDMQELLIAFTRRFMLGAWPLLQNATMHTTAQHVSAQPHVAAADEAAKLAMAEFSRAASLQQADFKTPYSGDQVKWRPLGATPLLLTEMQVTPQAEGRLHLNLVERRPDHAQPRSLQMQMEQALIHGLMQLLAQAIAASGWEQAAPWHRGAQSSSANLMQASAAAPTIN